MESLKVIVAQNVGMGEHNCTANLASNENDFVIQGGEVFVYRDCTICGDEFVTEYEYRETRPAN